LWEWPEQDEELAVEPPVEEEQEKEERSLQVSSLPQEGQGILPCRMKTQSAQTGYHSNCT
jgi:hypothetical protein